MSKDRKKDANSADFLQQSEYVQPIRNEALRLAGEPQLAVLDTPEISSALDAIPLSRSIAESVQENVDHAPSKLANERDKMTSDSDSKQRSPSVDLNHAANG